MRGPGGGADQHWPDEVVPRVANLDRMQICSRGDRGPYPSVAEREALLGVHRSGGTIRVSALGLNLTVG